ncbi:MAG: hypothetical protein AB1724_10925 [Thermodesulfobacteriota bacterium]
MNNLFECSPKELVTDGFLEWFITELDADPTTRSPISMFFYTLGLCDSSMDSIAIDKISRQEKNTDLIIRYHVNGIKTDALFENKTYTSTHSGQLKRYKDEFPGFKYYKYMKLGYIFYQERKDAAQAGYTVIDVYQLKLALDSVPLNNMLVNQYREFLGARFIDVQNKIFRELVRDNRHSLLEDSHGQAQQYILSELHHDLDSQIPYLNFKYAGNKGGTLWTQLDIARRKDAYGSNSEELLFWRIDKRGKGYYLRLNQYSEIKDANYWPQKKANLQILRNHIEPLMKSKGLVLDKPNNKGMNESEITILFFEDNHIELIKKHLTDLSIDIYKFYSSYNWV